MFILCSATKYWTFAIVFVYLYENKNMVLTFAQRIAIEIQSEWANDHEKTARSFSDSS